MQNKKLYHFADKINKTIFNTLQAEHTEYLKEPDQISQIPFTILNDPFVSIDIDFTWEESKSYKFELFKFYRSVNEKVKISQQSH